MNCDQAKTNIVAYAKGELSQGRKEPFEEHLAACPACRRDLESARRILSWTEAASDQAVIKKVDQIIRDAIGAKASDIHLEPQRDNSLRVRYRVDGVLQEAGVINSVERNAVVTRLKIMADTNVSVANFPQDGRIKADEQGYDIRVSFCPYLFGEQVVMRLLDRKIAHTLGLEKVYLYPDHFEAVKEAIHSPMGIFFTSGPTGSGKTTTMYSCLIEVNRPESEILTIEDPVEFAIDGVNQARVSAKDGFTFPAALRSFLRQDPDVIMVGEVRDHETVALAVQAALTGHLVLSTLHTNSAMEVVQRLRDMEVKDYLIAACLIGAINQRLARRVCPDCRQRMLVPTAAHKALGITQEDLNTHEVFKGAGCEKCRGRGYKGRMALYEVLVIDRRLSEMIGQGAPFDQLQKAAKEAGFKPMFEDARRKVLDGLTDAEECMRLLGVTE